MSNPGRITIKENSNQAMRFMDVRAYFNPPDDFSLVAVWSQSNDFYSAKYWGPISYEPNLPCTLSCDPSYYEDDRNCLLCEMTLEGCATCSSDTECLTCQANKLQYASSNGLQCFDECPAATYQRGSLCLDCDQTFGCANCSSATQCMTCLATKLQYVADELQCLDECPAATYQGGSSCFNCNSGCESCSSNDHCLTCLPTKLHYSSNGLHCLDECPTLAVRAVHQMTLA
jgi:hypothetical protein